MHTCIHTYKHTYIDTYVHTYINTYIHKYMQTANMHIILILVIRKKKIVVWVYKKKPN
jgi:hypothetical protein